MSTAEDIPLRCHGCGQIVRRITRAEAAARRSSPRLDFIFCDRCAPRAGGTPTPKDPR